MKVLFVQKEGGIFGAENYHLKIIPALVACGIQIDFLRLYTHYQGGKGGMFINRLKDIGITTFEINIGRFLNPINLFSINKIIVKGNYDIVHTHLIHADVHIALVKWLLNSAITMVSTKHGYDNAFSAKHGFNAEKQKLTPYFFLSKLAEKVADHSYAVSNALRDFFIATKLATKEKMKMIHYGFDYEDPQPDWISPAFRFYPKQFILAGRLVRFKGHHFVLQALSQVIRQHPDAGLIIIGSGELEEELKAMTDQLDLKQHVTFLGYQPQIPKWMYNSECVLVPSISEGFGIVLLEAFSCKRPVIAFDVPAPNEIIENGRTGFLVEPYSIEKLALIMNLILDNPSVGNQAGQQAFHRLKAYFSLKRMVDETMLFYQSVKAKR